MGHVTVPPNYDLSCLVSAPLKVAGCKGGVSLLIKNKNRYRPYYEVGIGGIVNPLIAGFIQKCFSRCITSRCVFWLEKGGVIKS